MHVNGSAILDTDMISYSSIESTLVNIHTYAHSKHTFPFS